MIRRFTIVLVAVLIATGLVLAGCGDDDENGDLLDDETTTTLDDGDAGDEGNGVDDDEGAMDAEALFAENCASCHGEDGMGAGDTPPAMDTGLSEDEIRTQIEEGGGGMPAFSDTLGDEEIDALVQYVHEGGI